MIRSVVDAVLSALLAPPCAVCARVLDRPLDGAVCERCWNAIATSPRRFCPNTHIQGSAAVGEYEGVLREIIHVLKYHGRRSTAPRLAHLMALHGRDVLTGVDAVVPVPLHPRRERERGFNQADDLARGLGLPVARVLRRTRLTAPQVELPATARHQNVKGAFELVRSHGVDAYRGASRLEDRCNLEGKVLVLVDDVTTTGATLEACARVLKHGGAREIRAITAARVSSGPQ